MRIVLSGIFALSLLLLGAQEMMWRLDHPSTGGGALSPSGREAAEVRFLPERSALPYGIGVFVLPRWALLHSLQAELVFTGYCQSTSPQWSTEHLLNIHCKLVEGQPNLLRPMVGKTVVRTIIEAAETSKHSFQHQHAPAPNPTLPRP